MYSRHHLIVAAVVFGAVIVTGVVLAQTGGSESDVESQEPIDVDSLVAQINQEIAGREEEPAEEVFEDIQILNGIPAGRVPMIMQFGFSKGLGVDCRHCHDINNFASNENPKKQVAREMWGMGKMINERLMEIPNLESKRPVVNCTTCHRGNVQPATNLD